MERGMNAIMHLRYIKATGTAIERGAAIGREWRQYIPTILKSLGHASLAEEKTELRDWLDHARAFAPYIEAHAPQTLLEMRGMADGAGVSLDDILLLSSVYEKHYKHPGPDHCTGFAAMGRATRNGDLIAGQTNDENIHRWAGGQLDGVVHHVEPSGMETLIYTHPGIPAYMGMNSAGLCVLWMAIDDRTRAMGVPTNILIRELLRFEILEEAVHYLERVPKTLPNNYLLSHPEQGMCNIEAFPDGCRAVYSHETLFHANHILDPERAANDVKNDLPENSTFSRCKAMETLLEKGAGRIDLPWARQALSDHTDYPKSICAHPHVDSFDAKTLASLVFQPSEGAMHISFGNGCETPFQRYVMDAFRRTAQE